ncbi:hypothetical protein G9A89_018143 [Geosiphon pyriformis]|nr:hypothetical protein G9A89_018143 [Geosiphon pyriformis]
MKVYRFIIDTSDATVMNLFSKQDKEHIMSFYVLSDPEIEDKLITYLIKYRKASEGCSRASGERKNIGRNNSKVKKLLGRKCDGIVRELGSPEEYGISEEGRHWTGKYGTKFLADGCLKLYGICYIKN